MRVAAVTGATGMIGQRLVTLLIAQDWQVRALQHHKSVALDGCEVIAGDLASEDAIDSLLQGAVCVFHCAAELHDSSRMHDINVLATRYLARKAIECGVGSFNHLSSAGVIGPAHKAWVDEADSCHPANAYEISKWQAEQVLTSLPDSDMRICMLRPANVVDDDRPGVVALAFRHGWRSSLSLWLKGAECAHLVHAEDVAAAALFLGVNETCSGAYFVGCDEDDRNTVAGVCNLARHKLGMAQYDGPKLPVAVPYYLRRIRQGQSLHGKTRFSSAKLLESGFVCGLGLEGAVERICVAHCRS